MEVDLDCTEDGESENCERRSAEENASEDLARGNSHVVLPETVEAHCGGLLESRIIDWRDIWSLIMTSGSLKVTKEQYRLLRSHLESISKVLAASLPVRISEDENKLLQIPHYSTIYKKIRPEVLHSLGLRATDHLVNVDMTRTGTRETTAALRLVLPSACARADIATPEVFSAICDTSLRSMDRGQLGTCMPAYDCANYIPLVTVREWFYVLSSFINEDDSDNSCPFSTIAENIDVIRISVSSSMHFTERIVMNFGENIAARNRMTL